MSMKPGDTTRPRTSMRCFAGKRLSEPAWPTRAMRSPTMATSPGNDAAPVPSITVPFSRTRSKVEEAGRGDPDVDGWVHAAANTPARRSDRRDMLWEGEGEEGANARLSPEARGDQLRRRWPSGAFRRSVQHAHTTPLPPRGRHGRHAPPPPPRSAQHYRHPAARPAGAERDQCRLHLRGRPLDIAN